MTEGQSSVEVEEDDSVAADASRQIEPEDVGLYTRAIPYGEETYLVE